MRSSRASATVVPVASRTPASRRRGSTYVTQSHGVNFRAEEPAEEIGLAAAGWPGETPLWYYILREAAVREGGGRLGPVGSLIVGEVLLGVIDGDPSSQRSVDPDWRPSLPSRQPGRFTLTDLLAPCCTSNPRLIGLQDDRTGPSGPPRRGVS